MVCAMFYKALIRPWRFQPDPEAAHERALNLAASLGRCRIARDAVETVFGFEDRRLLERDGFGSIAVAVGAAV